MRKVKENLHIRDIFENATSSNLRTEPKSGLDFQYFMLYKYTFIDLSSRST